MQQDHKNEAHDPRPRTAVLLQYTGIGDLVWLARYFEAVARTSRHGRVTLIAQPSTLARALLGHEEWLEEVVDHDHRPRRSDARTGRHAGFRGMYRMAQELRRSQFDRIVLFSGRPSRGLVARFSGIPQRLGYGYHLLQRVFLNSPPFIPRHEADTVAVFHEASDFAMAHGFCSTPLTPRLNLPATALQKIADEFHDMPRPLAALVIGTSEAHKQWGGGNFTELAERLLQKNWSVLLLGGPAESILAEEIRSGIAPSLAPRLTVMTTRPVLESAAALAAADVCVGNDTGMVHVAAAVQTPTWVLLGPRPVMDHDSAQRMLRASALSDITALAVEQQLDQWRRQAQLHQQAPSP